MFAQLVIIAIVSISIMLLLSMNLPIDMGKYVAPIGTVDRDSNDVKCSPLNETYENRVVEIDGKKYPQIVPMHFNKSINFECLNRGPQKRIFYWTRFWKSERFGLDVSNPFEKYNCPVKNCDITNDLVKFNGSDLVLIHAYDFLQQKRRFPRHKPNKQRWVFVYYEPPNRFAFDDLCYKKFGKNKFDLLNTYHPDSDFNSIYSSDAHFEWKRNDTFNRSFNYHATKVNIQFRSTFCLYIFLLDSLFMCFFNYRLILQLQLLAAARLNPNVRYSSANFKNSYALMSLVNAAIERVQQIVALMPLLSTSFSLHSKTLCVTSTYPRSSFVQSIMILCRSCLA